MSIEATALFIQANLVVVHTCGILISGPSGSGKTPLMIALIEQDHRWVADDAIEIQTDSAKQIIASAIEGTHGWLSTPNSPYPDLSQPSWQGKRLESTTIHGHLHLKTNNIEDQAQRSAFGPLERAGIDLPRLDILSPFKLEQAIADLITFTENLTFTRKPL